MLIYLLRHAEAESLAADDRSRNLTPKGCEQAARAGKFCRKAGLEPRVILTSPVARARQTAEIVAGELGGTELLEAGWAACGMDAEQALKELAGMEELSPVMLVGHQPDLGELCAVLLGVRSADALHVRKCLLAGIEMRGRVAAGRGVLQFFIPSRFMG